MLRDLLDALGYERATVIGQSLGPGSRRRRSASAIEQWARAVHIRAEQQCDHDCRDRDQQRMQPGDDAAASRLRTPPRRRRPIAATCSPSVLPAR